ncbi:hypothetical protein LZ31DRAFT_558124 [Colletotrichum somersetense]|nr:hypothetical protein LZ31DRAFT_558124 [Colletotrichum somersetense]
MAVGPPAAMNARDAVADSSKGSIGTRWRCRRDGGTPALRVRVRLGGNGVAVSWETRPMASGATA